MTAQTVEQNALKCGRCGMLADLCVTLRDECCVGCTHWLDGLTGPDVDEVAIERALAGDKTVTLNRDECAEAHRRLEARGLSAAEIADVLGTTQRSIVRWRTGQTKRPYTRPGATMSDEITTLLAEAAKNPAKRIRNAAGRAEAAIEALRALLADDEGKREARERVERLEAELRAAKAALRGGSVTAIRKSPTWTGEALQCRKGCGRTAPNPQGRAAHERHCTHAA